VTPTAAGAVFEVTTESRERRFLLSDAGDARRQALTGELRGRRAKPKKADERRIRGEKSRALGLPICSAREGVPTYQSRLTHQRRLCRPGEKPLKKQRLGKIPDRARPKTETSNRENGTSEMNPKRGRKTRVEKDSLTRNEVQLP